MTSQTNDLIPYVIYSWLIAVLIVCSITDLRQRRIPNLLTYSTALFAVIVHCHIDSWNGLLFSLGGLTFGFAIFLTPYLMGGMGAGDVKLMSAIGAVLGFSQTAHCFLFIAICGGVMSLGYMVHRRNLIATLTRTFLAVLYLVLHRDSSLLKIDKEEITQEGMPYGVAISGGAILFLLFQGLENHAFAGLKFSTGG